MKRDISLSSEKEASVSSERSVLEEANSLSEEDMEQPRFSSPRREESKQSKISKKTKETKKSVGFEKVFEDEEAHITSSQQSPSVKDSELSFEEADDLSEDEEDRKIKAIKENVRRKMSEEDSYEDSEYSSLPESYMDS